MNFTTDQNLLNSMANPGNTKLSELPPNLSFPRKQIRRKSSFVRRADSSEDIASPHGSIYTASLFSKSASDDTDENYHRLDSKTTKALGTKTVGSEPADINTDSSLIPKPLLYNVVIDENKFRYGHGTMLDTITERKSNATMNSSSRTKSFDDLKRPAALNNDLASFNGPKQKRSFSVDDLTSQDQFTKPEVSSPEKEPSRSLGGLKSYAQPLNPIQPPVERPQTPPGMPSWVAFQESTTNQHAEPIQSPKVGLWHKIISLSRKGMFWDRSNSNQPPENANTTPAQRFPRFRPPRSVYEHMNNHPFNSAPIARAQDHPSAPLQKQKKARKSPGRVRFTASATAQASEMSNLRMAIESTSSSALHPLDSNALISLQPLNSISTDLFRIQAVRTYGCPHSKGRQALIKSITSPISPRISLPTIHITPSSLTDQECSESPTHPGSSLLGESEAIPLHNPAISPRNSSLDLDSLLTYHAGPSTAHLIAGTNMRTSSILSPKARVFSSLSDEQTLNQLKPPPFKCWRCSATRAAEKVDTWCMNGTSLLCFVCCGFDFDDSTNLSARHV